MEILTAPCACGNKPGCNSCYGTGHRVVGFRDFGPGDFGPGDPPRERFDTVLQDHENARIDAMLRAMQSRPHVPTAPALFYGPRIGRAFVIGLTLGLLLWGVSELLRGLGIL